MYIYNYIIINLLYLVFYWKYKYFLNNIKTFQTKYVFSIVLIRFKQSGARIERVANFIQRGKIVESPNHFSRNSSSTPIVQREFVRIVKKFSSAPYPVAKLWYTIGVHTIEFKIDYLALKE